MTFQPGCVSSASDGSTFNSGDCDSGAQDMFGDSLSLNELRKTYPELYRFMHQVETNCDSKDDATGLSGVHAWKRNEDPNFTSTNVGELFATGDSGASLFTIRKAMSSIFECLNAVHVQKTSKLRLEIRDLCFSLQSLQSSREMDQSEIYRLQRENDRYRRELSQQAARYEDRITELHGVLAELQRKNAEMQSSSLTTTGNGTRTGVDDILDDIDREVPEDEFEEVSRDQYNPSDYTSQQPSSDAPFDDASHKLSRQEAWISASVRTVNSAQSDTAAIHMDNKDAGVVSGAPSSTSASVLGGGRPVMGLRQHNQTRKTRILSSQTPLAPGSSWLQQRRNSTTVANAAPAQQQQVSQPMSELSLHFDGGAGSATDNHERLTKSPSCDDRIRKSVSSVLSSSTSSVPQSCRSNGGVGDINDSENGLEEPQWVRHCLSRFQATEQQQQGRSTSSAGQAGIACWRMEDSMAERLLSCLANATPYPRLVDAARCALMVCEQRDAACAHREAEVLVLKASLAEVKAAGDQLQCRLEQIESSWCAASRAADLADLALETNNVLVHLYSSELAILLHKQPGGDRRMHKSSRPTSRHNHQNRYNPNSRSFSSSSSSSTSSSSSSSNSSDDEQGVGVLHTAASKQAAATVARPPRHPPTQAPSSNSGSNVYAVYAVNGKPEDGVPLPTWIPPHPMCNGPACLRLLRMQRQQTEIAALRLLARFSSTPEPFFKHDILPLDDLESLHPIPNATFGTSSRSHGNNVNATATESGLGGESGASSSGMGSHGLYANSWYVVHNSSNNNTVNNNQARFRGQPMLMGRGGWQTPDSGAGSCTTTGNEAATHHHLVAVHPNANINTTCSSASSSSVASSSRATGVVTGDGDVWNRVKELKLRRILDQILWERALVRNSTAAISSGDADTQHHPNGDLQYMRPYAFSEIMTYSDGGIAPSASAQDSREPIISSRLNALLRVDTAVLIEDLCVVKEDRAKLKVQNYIMEKELRAIQLSLQGHCLSESTLRSQLSTLQIDRNLQLPQTPDRPSAAYNNIAQQIESLQSAFETLRKGAEQHQVQSEELVNDLKQANAALITAFEKAKSKYLARIRKLEGKNPTPQPQFPPPSGNGSTSKISSSSCANISSTKPLTRRAMIPPQVPAHKSTPTTAPTQTHPLPPASPQSTSDVYEVIQDSLASQIMPTGTVWHGPGHQLHPRQHSTNQGVGDPRSYSLVRNTPTFYPKPLPSAPANNTNTREPSRPRC